MLTAQMVAYLVKLALLNAVKRVSFSPPPLPCPSAHAMPKSLERFEIWGKCYRLCKESRFCILFHTQMTPEKLLWGSVEIGCRERGS